mgnify:FL=1
MRIGICPGSFDPVTNGHIDIFERGSKLVDKLIVAVFENPVKKPLFTMAEREEMLRETTRHIPNIEVVSFHGLLNEYAIDHGATVIIRGLRALSDFEYEFQRALAHEKVRAAHRNGIHHDEYQIFLYQLDGHPRTGLLWRQAR